MEIVNWFKANYPELVLEMRECNHEISLDLPSPYHAEGDVWTHTLMVYNHVKRSTSLELRLAALLHDIGKPSCRHLKKEKNSDKYRKYYSFTGHENVSTLMAIDILKKFEVDFKKDIDKELVLKAINYHQDIHKLGILIDGEYCLAEEDKQFLNMKFGDFDLYNLMIGLSEADANGRFCEDVSKLDKQYEYLWNYIPTESYKKDLEGRPECIMLVGPPGVGKSTVTEGLLKEKEYVYLSIDSIVMEKNRQGLAYTMFWSESRRDEAIKVLYERLEKAISERKNIILDNTNIDEKARIRQLGKVPDRYYHKIAINVVTDIKTILERNKDRKKNMIRNISEDYIMYNIKNFSFVGEDLVHTSKVFIN